ncbi:MAG: hypothetical protein ABSB32_15760 [Thermodesulfobacteriota bacterium]|jgi:hypothetical protein
MGQKICPEGYSSGIRGMAKKPYPPRAFLAKTGRGGKKSFRGKKSWRIL